MDALSVRLKDVVFLTGRVWWVCHCDLSVPYLTQTTFTFLYPYRNAQPMFLSGKENKVLFLGV